MAADSLPPSPMQTEQSSSTKFDIDQVNYSLYLVTDSTDAILKGRHLPTVVKEAIEGGQLSIGLRRIRSN